MASSHRSTADNAAAAPIVYTAMHGVGAPFVRRAFGVMGLAPPIMVPEQEHPDPEFPTVAFPNPEEGEGAWSLSVKAGEPGTAEVSLGWV